MKHGLDWLSRLPAVGGLIKLVHLDVRPTEALVRRHLVPPRLVVVLAQAKLQGLRELAKLRAKNDLLVLSVNGQVAPQERRAERLRR